MEKHSRVSIVIGVDNQAALEGFKSELNGPAHSIAREILNQIGKLRWHSNDKKQLITLRWTARHEGIPGNDLADTEAKRAAERPYFLLPRMLKH